MKASEIRGKYIKFFEKKGHKRIPSASLVPQNDPTVLFTTAGMHPLVPYLLGEAHPMGKRIVDVQKCVRTDDIDEVGDFNHHTFFEMLGNWSLGDYFKKEAIEWSYEFLTKELGLDPKRLYITCFEGDKDAPKDEESAGIWESVGIPKSRIFFLGKKDNWWGPAGLTGPCGPDTEMHYDVTQKPHGENCIPGCDCGRFSEVWNDVFMEYNKKEDGGFEKLPKPNVDTGMGLERILAVVNGFDDDYATDLWKPVIAEIETLTGKKYKGNEKRFRIIADHVRASMFIIVDGVVPSNKEQGYILRRLIRRFVLQMKNLGVDNAGPASQKIIDTFVEIMSDEYKELSEKKNKIVSAIEEEISKFEKALVKGLKEAGKIENIDAKKAFDLYQSYGFPLELTIELFEEKGQTIEKKEFFNQFKKHQDLSRGTLGAQFKGGLADHSGEVTKLHTAHHLLLASLQKLLDPNIKQRGSNITSERLRMDFNFDRKLTSEELTKVEDLINEKVDKNLSVVKKIMPREEAEKIGAQMEFGAKYPDNVTVYFIDLKHKISVRKIKNTLMPSTDSEIASYFSAEFCGGPHVRSTSEIGHVRIIKQEKVGAGIMRIYATNKA